MDMEGWHLAAIAALLLSDRKMRSLHICVRPLQSVRSTLMGNAKASERENGQTVRLSRFFCIIHLTIVVSRDDIFSI